MFISKKRQPVPNPPLVMNGSVLEEVDTFKHLGVTLSKDLSWNKHIENLATTAGKCLDILNALKYKLDRVTLDVAFMLPLLDLNSNIVILSGTIVPSNSLIY